MKNERPKKSVGLLRPATRNICLANQLRTG